LVFHKASILLARSTIKKNDIKMGKSYTTRIGVIHISIRGST
jgi:hypothetical protein